MKHKHYDMIVAKAANMDLVVFEKQATATHDKELFKEISADGNRAIWFHESYDYFLCLPQHKEACLYWLNDGKAEENYNGEWSDIERHEWHDQSVFNFDDGYTIRIKPKKEKRWIAYHKSKFLFDAVGKSELDIATTVQNHELSDYVDGDWSFHEIEVEL